ncbi:hypothetical protein GOBAR_AA37056 [Gossypium barbadense]|uniref:Uncharacterized protein n=1 Tax=Gossypium barbadense TaxID=3634 RepID=A0A2P5VXU4_GOSBA|nr:hypothetical protein GOBAR_AA37056 [Gossypium barbadense]
MQFSIPAAAYDENAAGLLAGANSRGLENIFPQNPVEGVFKMLVWSKLPVFCPKVEVTCPIAGVELNKGDAWLLLKFKPVANAGIVAGTAAVPKIDGEDGNEGVTDELKRDEPVPNVGVKGEINTEVVEEIGSKRLDDVDWEGFEVVVEVAKPTLLKDGDFRLNGRRTTRTCRCS